MLKTRWNDYYRTHTVCYSIEIELEPFEKYIYLPKWGEKYSIWPRREREGTVDVRTTYAIRNREIVNEIMSEDWPSVYRKMCVCMCFLYHIYPVETRCERRTLVQLSIVYVFCLLLFLWHLCIFLLLLLRWLQRNHIYFAFPLCSVSIEKIPFNDNRWATSMRIRYHHDSFIPYNERVAGVYITSC